MSSAGTTVMMGLTGVAPERTDEMILAAMGRRVDAIISTAPLGPQTRELVERFGREDMEEVFLDMARGRGRGLQSLNRKEASP